MPFCPVCKSEFREEFTVCRECNARLVQKLHKRKVFKIKSPKYNIPKTEPAWPMTSLGLPERPVFLASVSSMNESAQKTALLRSCEIPVFAVLSDEPTSRAFHSSVLFGASQEFSYLYVPASLKEEALEILNTPPVFIDENFMEEDV